MPERVHCPQCDRPLRTLKQYHYCARTAIPDLFVGKPPELYPLYQNVEAAVRDWPGVVFSASKAAIVFAVARTFLVVRPLKNALDLSFPLPEPREGFPIYQVRLYGRRHEHYIRLYDEDDFSPDVVDLLRLAYELAQ